jgi:membrane-associated phospholipid phosphatase
MGMVCASLWRSAAERRDRCAATPELMNPNLTGEYPQRAAGNVTEFKPRVCAIAGLPCPTGKHSLSGMPVLSRYRLVDFATQGYLLFVVLVVLALRGMHWDALVALHLGMVVAVHALIASTGSSAGSGTDERRFTVADWREWLREFYPVLLYTGFYVETAVVNRMMGAPRLDPWLLRADHVLFGVQPAEAFPVAMAQSWFSEFMHLSYLSYHGMVGGVGLWLSLRDVPAFRHFVTVISLMFYACYASYLFVPAVGPRVLFTDTAERAQFVAQYGREPRTAPEANGRRWCQQAFLFVERHAEIPGAAFPSSHVAVAAATVWFSWRYVRRIRWLHLFFGFTILFSTVYTRAHYAVDVIGGLVAAAVLFPAAQAAYARTAGRFHTARS